MIPFPLFPAKLPKLPFPKLQISPHNQIHTLTSSLFNHQTDHQKQLIITQNPAKTIATLLSNCTHLTQVQQIHAHIIKTHFLTNHNLPINWNNLIRSYTRFNSPYHATLLYMAMQRGGTPPDNYTLPLVIKAFSKVSSLRTCQQLHGVAVKNGLERDEYVESGLISGYVKKGEVWDACKVFDERGVRKKKVGCWNAVIGGFSQAGKGREAVGFFVRMRRGGVEPDCVTMVGVNSACGGLGDLRLALQLHKLVFQVKVRRKEDGLVMVNSVVDMYGKCGRMDLACRVFEEMDEKNVSSWTSVIGGYGMHGYASEAMECFRGMLEANVMPNHVTFIGVLSACVHGGMVDEGKRWFRVMKDVYGIEPSLQHYGCMADLLGRAGLLKEARILVEEMPMKPNVVIWGCLLGACERLCDVEMGEWVAKHFIELEPWNDGVYVVLSNIYASKNMWEEVERIREIMKQRRLAKLQGYSLV